MQLTVICAPETGFDDPLSVNSTTPVSTSSDLKPVTPVRLGQTGFTSTHNASRGMPAKIRTTIPKLIIVDIIFRELPATPQK
jgi:hypothetical protein